MSTVAARLIQNTARGINVDDSYYRSLIAREDAVRNPVATSSADFNNAATTNELEAINVFANYLARDNRLEQLRTTKLEAIAWAMLRLERFFDESDQRLQLRIQSLLQRRFNPHWAGLEAIRDVLSYFTSLDRIWPSRFAVETSLLANGSFDPDMVGWTITASGTSSALRDYAARFDGGGGLALTTDESANRASAAQDVDVLVGTYRLNCFVSSEHPCSVSFQRASDGYYWTGSIWAAEQSSIALLTGPRDWELRTVHVSFLAPDVLTVALISPSVPSAVGYVDMVEFGVVPGYPFVDLFVVSFGQSGAFMPLSGGAQDPIIGDDYEFKGYLDQSYIGGSGAGVTPQFINGLLDIVKPAGVRVRYRSIERDV